MVATLTGGCDLDQLQRGVYGEIGYGESGKATNRNVPYVYAQAHHWLRHAKSALAMDSDANEAREKPPISSNSLGSFDNAENT